MTHHAREIPRWLCWLLGHTPCRYPDLSTFNVSCGCGRFVVTDFWMVASGTYRRRWTRFCARLSFDRWT